MGIIPQDVDRNLSAQYINKDTLPFKPQWNTSFLEKGISRKGPLEKEIKKGALGVLPDRPIGQSSRIKFNSINTISIIIITIIIIIIIIIIVIIIIVISIINILTVGKKDV